MGVLIATLSRVLLARSGSTGRPADVAPGHSSSTPLVAIIFLVVVGIAVVLIAIGVVLAVRRRRRRET